MIRKDMIAAIRRIVHVSLETACIVKGLPEPALAAAQAPISSSPRHTTRARQTGQ